jgi:nucleoside-diphosphate-sugar epimerase
MRSSFRKLSIEGRSMILVTGITGHSGKWFARRLVKERFSEQVRCLLRPTSDVDPVERIGLRFSKVIGDIEDPDFLDFAMKGVDTVLHIAQIQYSTKIVEAAVRQKVRWAILVHTTGRYSKFKSAATEYIAIEDNILMARNAIAITILRPTMIYGGSQDRNMYRLINYLSRHTFFPMFGSGKKLMQPVHARDLGNAYYDVLSNQTVTMNQEYNLAGKEPIAYRDLIRVVSHALGRKNVLIPIPMWFSLIAAKMYNAISKKPLISIEQVMRLNEDKVFSFERAAVDFGYSPIDFSAGIEPEVDEFLQSRASSSGNE